MWNFSSFSTVDWEHVNNVCGVAIKTDIKFTVWTLKQYVALAQSVQ